MSARSPDYRLRGAIVPRDLFPKGEVRFSLGVSPDMKGGVADKRRKELNKLRYWDRGWEVLRAIVDGRLEVGTVCKAISRSGETAAGQLLGQLANEALGSVPCFRDEVKAYLKDYADRRQASTLSAVSSRLKRVGEQECDCSGEGAKKSTAINDCPVDRIRSDHITTAVKVLSDKPNRREDIRVAVSGLYSWSIERERARALEAGCSPRWTENPARIAEKYTRESRVRVLSESEVEDLLRVAEPYQERYLQPFLHFGFRLSEYIHTRFGFDLNTTTWEWCIQERGPDPRCKCSACLRTGWKPKSKRSARTIAIPEELVEVRQGIVEELARYCAKPGDFVFRNPRTGKVWHARALADDFAKLCQRAGVQYGREVKVERDGHVTKVEGVTLHSLRHTCATNLLRADVRIQRVAAILGDTVKTVEDTYSHLLPQDLAEGIRQGPRYRSSTG